MFGVHHYNDLPVGPQNSPHTPISRLPPWEGTGCRQEVGRRGPHTPISRLPSWEVNVVDDTGCVYAQTLGDAGKGAAVILLGKVASGDCYSDAERRFAGWSETPRRPLSWFAQRVARISSPAPEHAPAE